MFITLKINTNDFQFAQNPPKIYMQELYTMATQLEFLLSTQSPWTFKSLGVLDISSGKFVESDLFPIGQIVELTEGHFPLIDYRDITPDDRHTFGGKVVQVTRFDTALEQEVVPLDLEAPAPAPVYKSLVVYVVAVPE